MLLFFLYGHKKKKNTTTLRFVYLFFFHVCPYWNGTGFGVIRINYLNLKIEEHMAPYVSRERKGELLFLYG
jgi:hypothetical protein